MKKQLHILIAEPLRNGIDQRAQASGDTITAIVEEYIRRGLARDSGELIEQNSLPALGDLIRTELSKNAAALHKALYDELVTEMRATAKRTDTRLAALVVRAIRESGISRRLAYTLLARAYTPKFAEDAFTDAKLKTNKELASRPTKEGE